MVVGSSETVAPLRVLLVDDVAAFRSAARACLQAMAGVDLIGEASGGDEAVAQVETLQPDVVLMDVHMARGNGLDAAKRMRARARSPQIVLFSLQSDDALRRAAFAAGADDFFPKSDFAQSVSAALARIIGNAMHISEQPTLPEASDTTPHGAVSAVLDLNNLLQEIMVKAALARRRLPADHPAHACLLDIETAGSRAGTLIRELVSARVYTRPLGD